MSANHSVLDPLKLANEDGHFRRPASKFRDSVSPDSSAPFPAERDRYVLYISYGCPWAHRANIARSLKGLEDIIQLVVMGNVLTSDGWLYDGTHGSAAHEPLYGFTNHSQLYLKADPEYKGRYTVPTLWDKKKETIVNNESSEIIRMFYSAFDELLPAELREANRPGGGYYPEKLRKDIDSMNEWVYDTVNNGVYKCGFAASQEAYDLNVVPLFESLDRLEKHLEDRNTKYLWGDHITDSDIRLYTTLVRFDVAYVTIFKCNYKQIRYDYHRLNTWLQRLYWGEDETKGAFKKTTHFTPIKEGYSMATRSKIVPYGPKHPIMPLNPGM
ncbi:hypothetical protein MMC17_000293 [Xylographa soralifera]|nr:hypothetical protein [Xylographa soralifera]